MNFDESVKYLYSLGNEVEAMKLGLENIRTLLASLGNPQNNYRKVQVAGTNGKGSVCAFLDSICNTAGTTTGTFTSPHLVSITERIRINGVYISEDDFARHATYVRGTAENLLEKGELEYRPTFFEQITAVALVAFAEAKVEVAILETGLGGRLDATTAANAEIAAITRIDLDHQEYLGDSIEDIAAEKAAIIRSDSKVIVAEQKDEAIQVIASVCANFGVSPKLAHQVRTTSGSGWLNFETEKAAYKIERLGLLGRHQIENAKIAILLAETLQEHFPITGENIADGLQNACHPGRLEFAGNFLFDGAHNLGGTKALKEYLDEFINEPITIIFGSMKDKDVGEIAKLLFPKAETLILTRPDNSRAIKVGDLAPFVPRDLDLDRVRFTESVNEALTLAKQITKEGVILVTGSLYLVGEVQKILKTRSHI